MTYLGEGGTSTGAFHEGINFASVQKLPLVVVLEFNRYSYSTPSEMQCGAATLADKAAGYGVASAIVDGNDVLAVVEAARRAVAWAREGNGPFLLECKTYRRKGHAEHDGQAYVDAEELAEWTRRDPIARFERHLDANGVDGRRGAGGRPRGASTRSWTPPWPRPRPPPRRSPTRSSGA